MNKNSAFISLWPSSLVTLVIEITMQGAQKTCLCTDVHIFHIIYSLLIKFGNFTLNLIIRHHVYP